MREQWRLSSRGSGGSAREQGGKDECARDCGCVGPAIADEEECVGKDGKDQCGGADEEEGQDRAQLV